MLWCSVCDAHTLYQRLFKLIQTTMPLSSSSKTIYLIMWSAAFSSVQHTAFIDWYIQVSHVGIFDTALWTAFSPVVLPLPFPLVHHYPSPFPVWKSTCTYVYFFVQCVRGGGQLDKEMPQSPFPEAEFMNIQFLGIILRVLRFEVSIHNVYITNQFQTTCPWGGGGGVKFVSKGDCE